MRHTRIIVTHYGGPDALRVVEEECPEPKSGEVRVRGLAAGVSLPDIMAREGIHPETPPVPFTPGWDLVGVVDLLGDSVSGIKPGQRVAAMPIHGAYAEFVCLPQHELIPVPFGLDAAEAVSLVLNYITAYQMLHHFAKLKPGQRALNERRFGLRRIVSCFFRRGCNARRHRRAFSGGVRIKVAHYRNSGSLDSLVVRGIQCAQAPGHPPHDLKNTRRKVCDDCCCWG